jgi:hypothetical protein
LFFNRGRKKSRLVFLYSWQYLTIIFRDCHCEIKKKCKFRLFCRRSSVGIVSFNLYCRMHLKITVTSSHVDVLLNERGRVEWGYVYILHCSFFSRKCIFVSIFPYWFVVIAHITEFLQIFTIIVCLNFKFPPPVELCWQNKNIF